MVGGGDETSKAIGDLSIPVSPLSFMHYSQHTNQFGFQTCHVCVD
jgi:hypothetical protein